MFPQPPAAGGSGVHHAHTLRALRHDGKTELTETIDVPGERWAVLDFWFYTDEEPEGFTFSIHDRPVGFDWTCGLMKPETRVNR